MNRIEIFMGDITKVPCDALVTAANAALAGGGGVDGAVHAAAGPNLLEECKKLEGCPTGEARITPGFDLGKPVIHAVGPIWHGGRHGEEYLLSSAYRESLILARNYKIQTLAFPCISTGVYGYPPEMASRIAFSTVAEFLFENDFPKKVIFVCFNERDLQLYTNLKEESGES